MFVVDAVGYEEIILKQYEKSHQLFLVLSLCYVSIYSNLLSCNNLWPWKNEDTLLLQLSASETAEMEISIYFAQLTASSTTEYIFYIACFSINVERKACQWIFFSEIAKFTRKSSMHHFLFTMTMFQFFQRLSAFGSICSNKLFNILHFLIVQLKFFGMQ